MKRKNLLLMAGLIVFILPSSQAFAFDIEEDMAEGITLSVQKSETNFKYDNSMTNKESMTEFVFFPEKMQENEIKKYAGDPSCPTGEQLMAEDDCLDSSHTYVAGK